MYVRLCSLSDDDDFVKKNNIYFEWKQKLLLSKIFANIYVDAILKIVRYDVCRNHKYKRAVILTFVSNENSVSYDLVE